MIEKIKQKIEQNKVYIIATLFGVSAIGAFFYFKSKNSKGKKITQGNDKELSVTACHKDLQETQTSQSYQEKVLVRELNRLKRLNLEQGQTYQIVKQIYKSQLNLSRQEFKSAILSNRRQRRNLLGNIVEYEKVLTKYENKVQQIHNKHLNAVLAHFRIGKGVWMQLRDAAKKQKFDMWNELLISTEEQELLIIRAKDKPKLKISVLIDVQKYRLKVLKQRIEQFKNSFTFLDKPDLYNLVQKWAADNIQAKFHVEEQDIIFSRQQLTAGDKQNLQSYEQDTRHLMQELICDDPNSESLQYSNARQEQQSS